VREDQVKAGLGSAHRFANGISHSGHRSLEEAPLLTSVEILLLASFCELLHEIPRNKTYTYFGDRTLA
jgi:hypothetical protein